MPTLKRIDLNRKKHRLLGWYIAVRENPRGQTLAEYALIFAALSLAAFTAYQTIGNGTLALGNGLNSELTNA
ncbi:MAG TPA: hypothetical protein VGI29_02650 [Candidatus Binataceae bacterium]|jgi:Flp pilus assembly pilin Flp